MLMGSLAIADLLTGMLVPLSAVLKVVTVPPTLCLAAIGILSFGPTVSMQHIMLIGIDRYIAVR